jgi:hypothetical protein
VEISPAGCSQPIISSPDLDIGGNKVVRVVQHTLDFDNNEPWSEYVQFYAEPYTTFPATTTANSPLVNLTSSTLLLKVGQQVFGIGIPQNTTIQYVLSSTQIVLTNSVTYTGSNTISVDISKDISIRTDFGGGNMIGEENVDPKNIIVETVGGGSYFKGGFCTYNSSTQDYTVAQASSIPAISASSVILTTTASTSQLRVGMNVTSKLLIVGTANGTTTITGMATTANITAGMEVSSISGPTIPIGTTVVSKTSTSVVLSNSVSAGSVEMIFNFDLIPANTTIYSVGSGSIGVTNVVPSFSGGALYLRFSFDTNITALTLDKIGSYVFVSKNYKDLYDSGISTYRNEYLGVALKIKSLSPLKLDANDAYCLKGNREWEKRFLGDSTFASKILYGTKTFISVWESISSRGIYYYRSLIPTFPESTTYYSEKVTLTGQAIASSNYDLNLFTLGPVLNTIYDVNSRKLSPNSTANFGGRWNFLSSTIYQDQILLANDDLVWVSDTTLGGSFEQFNASIFIKVGDAEYGRITSICGTNDFLIICRERKNYYVNGNLSTGNYRVQEITGAEIGAWSNNSSILVKDSVIFISASGVYQVSDGGRCIKLSESCPKNFSTYDEMNVNEDVSFRLLGTIAGPTFQEVAFEDYENNGISIAYDEYRELLAFLKRGTENPCLVLNTKTMEFYEWDGLTSSATKSLNCIQFSSANYLIGELDSGETSYNAKMFEENKSVPLDYPTHHPIKLYTTWLTANEPSLEKILLQLKIFGRIQSNGTSSSINVAHYKDWDINTKITNAPYFPNSPALSLDNQVQYSHKKRFNSDKILAASVGIEVNSSLVSFEIESLEVEMNPIQEGVKK